MRALFCLSLLACGTPPRPTPVPAPLPEEDCGVDRYQEHSAWDGGKPALPVPPTLPTTPKKIGDAYTVFGAIHQLQLDPAPLSKDITIIGVIVDSNVTRVPKCAWHKTGKADPEGCVTEIPTFRLADAQGDALSIPVMGWASNFPNVFEAHQRGRMAKPMPWDDANWAVRVPTPLPAPGAKVKVTGHYGFKFTKSSMGISTEPRTGILTYVGMDVIDPSPSPITIP